MTPKAKSPVSLYVLDMSSLPTDAPVDLACLLLAPRTAQRIAAIAQPIHRRARLMFTAAWQTVLAQHVHLPPGSELPLGIHGKPYVDGGPSFGVSHTDRVGALAVGALDAIGLDIVDRSIERRPLPPLIRRAVLSFTDGRASGEGADDATVWARLEALVKRDGLSLGEVLDGCAAPVSELARKGVLVDVPIGFDHAVALAADRPVTVEVRQLDWQEVERLIHQRASGLEQGRGQE
jgi:hypothetical protein